jgi:hypothetical protein
MKIIDLFINLLFRFRCFLNIKKYLKYKKIVKHKIISLQHLNSKDKKSWIKGFTNLMKTNIKKIDVFLSFADANIKTIRTNHQFDESKPILMCVVKDDLIKVKLLIEHHRQIGIENFVFLDNGSTDGTYEYLLEDDKLHIYRTEEKYTSSAKYGWINRILSYYGFNRWYLYVDSDENFVYIDCEKTNINELIKKMHKKKVNQLHSLLIDMYSKDELYKNTSKNYINQYKYFDAQPYRRQYKFRGVIIRGGPRRIFFDDTKLWPILNKTPLFILKRKMIFESAHFIFPYRFFKPINSALLHYKFMVNDRNKYIERTKKGNFAEGSREYKAYLNKISHGKINSFYNKKSIIYNNSNSLLAIKYINKL